MCVCVYIYACERARAHADRRTDSRQTDGRGWFSNDGTPLVACSGASLAVRDTPRDGTGAKRTVYSLIWLAGSVTRSAATAAAAAVRKCHR